ncbi:MAG: hypothetical protein V3V05_11875 [Pontiella sp.]
MRFPKTECSQPRFKSGLVIVPLIFAAFTAVADDFVEINSLQQLRVYAPRDHMKVRMKPGTYRVDDAPDHHFFRFTGNDSHFDLTGVTFEIDNQLFNKFGVVPGKMDSTA